MECNRDEAIRSKEIAERKFKENDIAGAKKFALKAKTLFSALDGINQMISTFDVYLTAEKKVGGENDWYCILQVPPLADEETIKKQYKKLALQFHPDKNRATGADGAFKLISDAWSVLSEKSRRMAYDQKRNSQRNHQNTFQANRASSTSNAINDFSNFTGITSTPAGVRQQKQKASPAPPIAAPSSQPSKPNSFWTYCGSCKIHFEYIRTYLNHHLPCPNCQALFIAVEVPPPSCPIYRTVPKPSTAPQTNATAIPNRAMSGLQKGVAHGLNDNPILQRRSIPRTAANAQDSTHIVQQAHEKVRREQEAEANAVRREEAKLQRKINTLKKRAGVAGSSTTATKESEIAKRRKRADDAKKVVWDSKSSGPHGTSGFAVQPGKRGPSTSAGASGVRGRKVASGDLNYESSGSAGKVTLGKVVSRMDTPRMLIENMKLKLRDQLEEFKRKKADVKKKDKAKSSKTVDVEEKEKMLSSKKVDLEGKQKVRSSKKTDVEEDKKMRLEVKERAQSIKIVDLVENEKAQSSEIVHLEGTEKAQSSKQVDLEEKEKARKRSISDSEEKLKVYKKRNCKEYMKETGDKAVHGNSAKQNLLDDASASLNQAPPCNDSSDDAHNEMPVPDADFYKFGDHSESSFRSDQLWAVYDEEDGMPRYYALVQKVLSMHPFKIRIAYLKAKSSNEFGTLNGTSSGFSKTCGDFKVGKCEDTDQLNSFSHVVMWERGPRGVVTIFPKKRDIWALYQNWSPDWDEFTPDDVIYKYEMVEVLDGYNPDEGISVVPLVKVAGFTAVFQRLLDPKKIKTIPREEMFRFSHQVPFHVLTGEEAQNSPEGCYELDPASTPKELLQVVPEPADATKQVCR